MDKDKKGNNLVSFIIGAIVGAAAVFFSNTKNRNKAKEKIDEMKDRASDVFDTVKGKAENLKEEVEGEFDKTKGKLKKKEQEEEEEK